MALGLCGLVKQLYRPVCSYFRARKNRLLAGFSAVAQTRQLSHTACSLSFAYFNARIFTTTKTRVRRGHLKWHFPVASARCQAVVLPKALLAPQATFLCATARSRHQFDALSASKITRDASLKPHTSPVSALIPRSQQKAARAGKNRPIPPDLLKIYTIENSAWSPGQFLAGQDGHTAPVRSSQLSPGGPR